MFARISLFGHFYLLLIAVYPLPIPVFFSSSVIPSQSFCIEWFSSIFLISNSSCKSSISTLDMTIPMHRFHLKQIFLFQFPKASQTGVRLQLNCWAISSSVKRTPGKNIPSMIAFIITKNIASLKGLE